tara:strand:- start:789 stop:1679 length:891 start_codon:yes stop_codon:yes gene_type:complete
MSSPATKNVSAQTKTPSPQKKTVAKKEAATDKPAAKPRKPSLKEKHSRFLVSNYSLIQYLSAKGLMTEEAVETAYSEIKLFAPVDEQEAFYDAYITESKTTKKTMKKFITQRNKPPKAPRAKKEPKAKKEGTPKEKKPRAKKTTKVENDTEVDVVSQIAGNNDGAENLINELTAAANQSPTAVTAQTTPTAADTKVEEAPGAPEKKTRKPRAKKDDAAPKDKKPRAKKNAKKEEEAPPVVNVQEEVNEEEEEIHTQEITIDGTLYLIDGENNLYSTETHEQVGTYNADANEVVANA